MTMEQKFLLPVLLLLTMLIGCERVGYDSEGEEGMIDTLCGTTWERSYKVKDYSYKEQYTSEKTGKGNFMKGWSLRLLRKNRV